VRLLSRVRRLEKMADSIKPRQFEFKLTDDDVAQVKRAILARLRISDPWPELDGKGWLRALRGMERQLGIPRADQTREKIETVIFALRGRCGTEIADAATADEETSKPICCGDEDAPRGEGIPFPPDDD